MSIPILATKLYVPPPRPGVVLRTRLVNRLNNGLHGKLTLISAPAGFGKTTLVSEWVAGCKRPVAWLSLDKGDNDPASFLTYLVAALQTIKAEIGAELMGALQSPQSPHPEIILTTLINEITTIADNFVLVLDDYHVLDAKTVDDILTFILEHQPPQMHLVIATREDPSFPLARLRASGQMNELRAADLRFTPGEAAQFLNQVKDLNLSAEDIAALETRTEGWIAGLQMAAISMQGLPGVSSFINSFTGSNRFVLDYLLEEVWHRQPAEVQTFLLRTSILERMCGPLCDAVLGFTSASGQGTLESLERASLFIVPLDNERRWYRYHHLFADSLRQKLRQSAASFGGDQGISAATLHIRASRWYEDNGLEIEAFQHAAAGNDIERAERLIEGRGLPLHFRGAAASILDWLGSLPNTVLDARPSLWVRYARLLMITGQTTGVEEKLQAAEKAMKTGEPDDKTRDLIGRIAAVRANLAFTRYQAETIIFQARRALEYLHPDNLFFRFTAIWTLGFACLLQGDRAAAGRAFTEALSISQETGDTHSAIIAITGLGNVQEMENQFYQAADSYRRVLQLAGDFPQPVVTEANRGLACIFYEWNDLNTAEHYGQQSLKLARQFDKVIDRFVISEVLLARLKLAHGDVAGAAGMLSQIEQSASQKNFTLRLPEIAAARVQVLLKQGNLTAAAELVSRFELPLSKARVLLAKGDPSAALTVLESFHQKMEAKGWADELLKTKILEAIALRAHGEKDKTLRVLSDAMALAEPGGFIRIFVDEGAPMAHLLSEATAQGIKRDYVGKLLAAFKTEEQNREGIPYQPTPVPSGGTLSQREVEVLRLLAQGLSNREISQRLFLALDTVKGHNRIIFGKLQVQRRTEAVARARELGLL